jgi:hypothetical protein
VWPYHVAAGGACIIHSRVQGVNRQEGKKVGRKQGKGREEREIDRFPLQLSTQYVILEDDWELLESQVHGKAVDISWLRRFLPHMHATYPP